ncbi:hypothetical protein V2O64_14440 [Verrucomicrobiaceae bacterium 227]
MKEAVRHSHDFFAALGKLDGLDRNSLRALAEEVLVFAPEDENRSPKDETKYLARNAILAAIAERDPLWILEQKEGNKGGFELAAFQNLLEDSEADALAYYESLGEERYSYAVGGKGLNNRLFQLVFAHLASRDPEAAVEHLFSMDVKTRSFPPAEMWVFETAGQARALWEALKKQEDDQFHTKTRAMWIAAQNVYETNGIEGMKELWDGMGIGKERLQFFRDAQMAGIFRSPQGARDLQQLLAEESASDRQEVLGYFASGWGYLDRSGVENWMKTLPGGPERDQIVNFTLEAFSDVDERPKMELVELINDNEIRKQWEERMTE